MTSNEVAVFCDVITQKLMKTIKYFTDLVLLSIKFGADYFKLRDQQRYSEGCGNIWKFKNIFSAFSWFLIKIHK